MATAPEEEKIAGRTPPPSSFLLDQVGPSDGLEYEWQHPPLKRRIQQMAQTTKDRIVQITHTTVMQGTPWALLGVGIFLKAYGIENPGPVGDFIQHEGEITGILAGGTGLALLTRIRRQSPKEAQEDNSLLSKIKRRLTR